MVNPELTILFDLGLIGTAVSIVVSMAREQARGRSAEVGGRRTGRSTSPQPFCPRMKVAPTRQSRAVEGRRQHWRRVA